VKKFKEPPFCMYLSNEIGIVIISIIFGCLTSLKGLLWVIFVFLNVRTNRFVSGIYRTLWILVSCIMSCLFFSKSCLMCLIYCNF